MSGKIFSKTTLKIFVINFLPFFMLLIFGPAEIFFSNAEEFEFVYGEFAGYLAVSALGASLILTLAEVFLPDKIRGVLLSLSFGFSLAGYLQIMFWNKNLDMLGLNPEGYRIDSHRAGWNLAFWALIIFAVIFLSFWRRKLWKNIVYYVSALVLCMQVVALISLMITARESAYRHPETALRLSGRDQLTVSANQNIIVIILDYLGSEGMMRMNEAYPGAADFLHDFTSYSNADSVYFGTYPSLAHMLTGRELDMTQKVDDWCADIWTNENTERFYSELRNQNYVVNLYTPDTNVLCGLNDTDILKGKFSNLEDMTVETDVYYSLLLKTMIKMSGYRMLPEILKPNFYTNISEYAEIVSYTESEIIHENYLFYDALLEQGLAADDRSNYLIVQHLQGAHDSATDANCRKRAVGGPLEDSAKGCMVLVEEYLNQLKALGVYDNSTIIITADHGDYTWAQVVFYVKEAGETHDVSPVNNAPVTHREFFPTLAEYAGLDHTQYGSGQSIHDYTENDVRERTFWVRESDPHYPSVPCYTGVRQGWCNVYNGFTYTGDLKDMMQIDWSAPDIVVPMVDSFF